MHAWTCLRACNSNRKRIILDRQLQAQLNLHNRILLHRRAGNHSQHYRSRRTKCSTHTSTMQLCSMAHRPACCSPKVMSNHLQHDHTCKQNAVKRHASAHHPQPRICIGGECLLPIFNTRASCGSSGSIRTSSCGGIRQTEPRTRSTCDAYRRTDAHALR